MDEFWYDYGYGFLLAASIFISLLVLEKFMMYLTHKITKKYSKEGQVADGHGATCDFGGLSTLLTVVFVVLKLTDNIDWSWWWVLAPIWIPLSIFFVLVISIGVLFYFDK